MISRRKGFLILGLIFGGFLGSLAFLLSGDTEYKVQPTFAEIYSPFTIIDYQGDTISSCDWNDKIVLYNFLSVNCPTDFEKCPFRLEWFKIKIYNELVDNEGFEDVIVVTSFIDSLKNLDDRINEFRTYNNINSDKWIMTGTKYIPYFDNNLAKGNPWINKDTLFGFERQAHLMTLLVDKSQKVRGKYFTYNFGEIRRITKEISLLIKEEKEKLNRLIFLFMEIRIMILKLIKTQFIIKFHSWSFSNQNGVGISSKDLNGKVHLVDFFFTNCPTICPKMTLNMKKIQDALKIECLDNVELLSFTVDPKRDSIERLNEYANSYNLDYCKLEFINWRSKHHI